MADDSMLDEATKADIAKRAKVVADGGAIKPLVQLCVGPEGPLPDLEAAAAAAAEGGATDDEGGKGGKKGKVREASRGGAGCMRAMLGGGRVHSTLSGLAQNLCLQKKKGGKKKKGKLEPGMAEVQTWSSAVLRMIR